MRIDELLEEAKQDLIERIKYGISYDDPQDQIAEIADSCIPIYNADRIEIFLDDSDFWFDSCGDAETILDAITWAIYERINEYLWGKVSELYDEYSTDEESEDEDE